MDTQDCRRLQKDPLIWVSGRRCVQQEPVCEWGSMSPRYDVAYTDDTHGAQVGKDA